MAPEARFRCAQLPPGRVDCRAMTVVVLDDDAHVRAFAVRVLESAGHRVHSAPSGTALLQASDTPAPDVVVTDIFMPDADGFEVLRHLRRTHPGVPVVVMSGGHGESMLAVARAMRAAAILVKPFGASALVEAVANVAAVASCR